MSTNDIDRAIEYINECRQVHIDWINWQHSGSNWKAEVSSDPTFVGEPEHHEEWVEKYDHVLNVLKAYNE